MSDSTPSHPSDPGIAVALSSAFLGVYAHGGFLCGLNQAGIFPGHIAGASAGALAGGFYAAGFRGPALEETVLSATLKKSYFDLLMFIRGAPLSIGILTGIMGGKRVVRHLKSVLPVAAIEETPEVKLSIAVTDLRRSEALFLTSGPLAESIMASCAVPILFSGQDIGGRKYHDGGITNEIPLEPFTADPAIHTIIIHKIIYPGDEKKNYLSIRAAFINGHNMLNDALQERRQKEAESNGKRVIILETRHTHPGILQSKATKKRCFEDGYRTGSSISNEIKP